MGERNLISCSSEASMSMLVDFLVFFSFLSFAIMQMLFEIFKCKRRSVRQDEAQKSKNRDKPRLPAVGSWSSLILIFTTDLQFSLSVFNHMYYIFIVHLVCRDAELKRKGNKNNYRHRNIA